MSDWSFESDSTVSESDLSDDNDGDLLLSIISKSLKGPALSLASSRAPELAVSGDDFDIDLPPIFKLVAPLNDKVREADQVLSRKLLDDENLIKQEYADLIAHKKKILLELNSTGSRIYSLTKDSDQLNDLVHQDQSGTLHRRYYFFPADISVDQESLPYGMLPIAASYQLLDILTPYTPRLWLVPLAHYALTHSENVEHFDILCNAFIELCDPSASNENSIANLMKRDSTSNSSVKQSELKAAHIEALTDLAVPLSFTRYMNLISSCQGEEMPLILPRRVPGIEISVARAQLAFAIGIATSGCSREMLGTFIRIACDFGARKYAFPRLAKFVTQIFPIFARTCSEFPESFVTELRRIRTTENSEYSSLRQHDYQLQFSVLELLNVCIGPSQNMLSIIYSINCSFLAGQKSDQRGTPAVAFLKPIFRALAHSLSNIEAEVTLDFYLCYYKICLLDYILAQPFSVATSISEHEQKTHIVNIASLLGQLHSRAFLTLKNVGLNATKMSPPLRQRLVQCLTDASTRLLRLHTRFHAVQTLALDDIFYG